MPRAESLADWEEIKQNADVIGEAIRRAIEGDPEPVMYPPTGEPLTVELIPGGLGAAVSTPSKPRFTREKWGRPPSHHEDDREGRTSLEV